MTDCPRAPFRRAACTTAFAALTLATPAAAADFGEEAVRARCASEWPGDFRMQAYCLDQDRRGFTQVEASRSGLDAAMRSALDSCAAQWPAEWRMIAYCLDQQIDGRNALPGAVADIPAHARDAILDTCAGEWPGDFRMQAYCTGVQADGWRRLNR